MYIYSQIQAGLRWAARNHSKLCRIDAPGMCRVQGRGIGTASICPLPPLPAGGNICSAMHSGEVNPSCVFVNRTGGIVPHFERYFVYGALPSLFTFFLCFGNITAFVFTCELLELPVIVKTWKGGALHILYPSAAISIHYSKLME